MSNCSDFLLLKEDHTLGNLLSAYLRMAPHVMLAGYKSMFLPFHFSHHPHR
jgi:DNA-directed RNA polymerase II subunit RPB11